MKSLRLIRTAPSVPPALKLETLPTPDPQPNHILIKVRASPIHPSDLINSRGGFGLTTFPRTPGRDFSGTVVSPNSSPLIGKDVYGTSGFTQAFSVDGAQAEFISVPEDAVAVKPKNLSFVQAACIGVPFTTASLVLKRAGVKKGESVLVLGANGTVGSAVVQLAVTLGAKVFKGVRGSKGDVDTGSDPELSALDTLTDGKGVDVVVDTVGMPGLTNASVGKLGRGGRLAFIAAPRTGSTGLDIEMVDFYRKEKSLIGCNTLLYSVEEFAKELAAMTPKFEDGSLKAAPAGEWNELRLDDGLEAYEKASQKGGGKVVIVMD